MYKTMDIKLKKLTHIGKIVGGGQDGGLFRRARKYLYNGF